MSQETIPAKALADLLGQLENQHNDKDRIRLIEAAADGHWFTTYDVIELVNVQHYGPSKTQTAILLYPKTTDPESYDYVIECYKFEEDRKEIKEALGL
eukprot:CAMPEP_0177653154 /NCGR_PEP_ID=MMETSP0447-20121125/13562_1 /TAXON_ID=0 /ORGANISM="Stygamoeba regulata, Strain BSH-02190019" /LENGTH=97 /DNA_ID=CAMNT_0019156547 /DNA_START=146 /DNA_END=439 /DNA_ORIENTATION=-